MGRTDEKRRGAGEKARVTRLTAKSSVRTRLGARERWAPAPSRVQTQSRGKEEDTRAEDFDFAAIST